MGHFEIRRDVPLKPFTTFKVGGPAKFFASATTHEDFLEALKFAQDERLPVFVLGGGSNILVSDDGFEGLVIHPVQRGISVADAEFEQVTLRIEAGETWDEVVRQAVEEGFWGIENLSHIPGQAGAAIVQNIGAYGRQISDVFISTTVMEIRTGKVLKLEEADCRFGYRQSIFNTTTKNEYIILQLELKLARRGKPDLRYPDVRRYFSELGVDSPSIKEVREAIIRIRDRKFPYPREEKGGNAGSFFKNLILSESEFEVLRANIQRNFPKEVCVRLDEIRRRSDSAESIRVPTAFLIEICGLKGHREGRARVNETQPLVLLNDGGATARDVLTLASCVRRTVRARTGMTISFEPELVGFGQEEIERYLALD
jgi:UDP-N-acetylmuramate dehydrogenase